VLLKRETKVSRTKKFAIETFRFSNCVHFSHATFKHRCCTACPFNFSHLFCCALNLAAVLLRAVYIAALFARAKRAETKRGGTKARGNKAAK